MKEKVYYFSEKRIERFAIPNVHLSGYFERKITRILYRQEIEFAKKNNFEHLDEFLCFRSIVLSHNLKGQQIYKISSYNIDESQKELLYKTFTFYLQCGALSIKTIKSNILLDNDKQLRQLQRLNLHKLSSIHIAVIGFSIPNLILSLELIRFGFQVTLSYYSKQNKSDFEGLIDFSPFSMSQYEGDKIYNLVCENKLPYQPLPNPVYLNQHGGLVQDPLIKQAQISMNQLLQKIITESQNDGYSMNFLQKLNESYQLFQNLNHEENLVLQNLLQKLMNFDLPQYGKTAIKQYLHFLRMRAREIGDNMIEPCYSFLKFGSQDILLKELKQSENFNFISSRVCSIKFNSNLSTFRSKRLSEQSEQQNIQCKYENGKKINFDYIILHPNSNQIQSKELDIKIDSERLLLINQKLDQLIKFDLPKYVMEFKVKFWKDQYFCTYDDKYGSIQFIDISSLKALNNLKQSSSSSSTNCLLILISKLPQQLQNNSIIKSDIIQILMGLTKFKFQIDSINERWIISSQFTPNGMIERQINHQTESNNDDQCDKKFSQLNKGIIYNEDHSNQFQLKLMDGLYINQCIFQGNVKDKFDVYYSNTFNIINSIINDANKLEDDNIEKQPINQKNYINNDGVDTIQGKVHNTKETFINSKRRRLSENEISFQNETSDESDSDDEIVIKKKQKLNTLLLAKTIPVVIDERNTKGIQKQQQADEDTQQFNDNQDDNIDQMQMEIEESITDSNKQNEVSQNDDNIKVKQEPIKRQQLQQQQNQQNINISQSQNSTIDQNSNKISNQVSNQLQNSILQKVKLEQNNHQDIKPQQEIIKVKQEKISKSVRFEDQIQNKKTIPNDVNEESDGNGFDEEEEDEIDENNDNENEEFNNDDSNINTNDKNKKNKLNEKINKINKLEIQSTTKGRNLLKLSEQLPDYYPFRFWKQKSITYKNYSNNNFLTMANNFSLDSQVVINFNNFQNQLLSQNRQYHKQCLELFELRKPLKISEDKYIWKFGLPYIDDQTGQYGYNNGFMSVYRDFSITYTNRSTFYLFASMYIKEYEREYYAIISADNLKVVHAHKDMTILFNKFQKSMNKTERYRNSFCYNNFVNPFEVLSQITYKLIYSSILENLSNRQEKSEIEKKLLCETSEILFFQSVDTYLQRQLKLYNLPSSLSLGHLFFGYYDPKILLLMKLSKHLQSLKRDNSSEETKFLFEKSLIPRKNDLEQDKISTEFALLQGIPVPILYLAQRKFIDYDNGQFEIYYELEIKSQKKQVLLKKNQGKQQQQQQQQQQTIKFVLTKYDEQQMSKKEKKNEEFDNPQSCFIFIMQRLLNNIKDITFLLEYMYQFINSEMRALKKFPKKIRYLNKIHTIEVDEIQQYKQIIIENLTQSSIDQLKQKHYQISGDDKINQAIKTAEDFFENTINYFYKEQIQNQSPNYMTEKQIFNNIIKQYSFFHVYVFNLDIPIDSKKEMFKEYALNPNKYNVIQSSENQGELFLISSEIEQDYQSLDNEFQLQYQKEQQAKKSFFQNNISLME